MKIFITGVAGFVGSHLADKLLADGHEIIGVDNLVGGFIENVNKDVIFYNADCDDLNKMVEYSKGCDVVFHAACTAHDGFSLFSPYYITKNTFQITMSVLSAAVQNKVKKFIFCSSMSRYGKQSSIPYTEDMICNPVVPYGEAKLASEKIVRQICELNGIEYIILVPHNIYGPRQCAIDPYRNVAAIMINRMLQGKQPIIYGDGTQKRCFSYIDDVVYCVKKAVISNGLNGEIINIGPDENFISIIELAEYIAKILKFNLDPIFVPMRPQEIKFATCSSDKARKLLNYQTKTSLVDGLRNMVEYMENRGPEEFKYNYDIEIVNSLTPKTWVERLI